MAAASTTCPSQTDLLAFASGSLSGLAFQRLARHVEMCPACEATLAELDDPGDPLLSALREATVAESLPEAPVPHELLTAARDAFHAQRESGSDSASLPRRLGKFELLEELGVGSFGQVFRARDLELDRIVAIKMLRAGRLAGREEVDRFLREARSAARRRVVHDRRRPAARNAGLCFA